MEESFMNIINRLPSATTDDERAEIYKQFKYSITICNKCLEKFKKGEALNEKEEKIWVYTHKFLADIYPNDSRYIEYKDNKFLCKHFPRYYINTMDKEVLFEMFPQLYIDITSQALIEIKNKK